MPANEFVFTFTLSKVESCKESVNTNNAEEVFI